MHYEKMTKISVRTLINRNRVESTKDSGRNVQIISLGFLQLNDIQIDLVNI